MQILPNNTGSDSGKSIFSAIESAPEPIQCSWDDSSTTPEGHQALISQANKSVNLLDYMYTKTILEHVSSNSGWTYRTKCPFHKHGDERTPSFFLNTEENRFYCQACSISGGIVEYIATTYKRPIILVARHILQCVNGNYNVESVSLKKAADRKKFQINMLKISDLHRVFIHKYIKDEDALIYLNKCYQGFDDVLDDNQEAIEENIEEIVKHFEQYLQKYGAK